MKRRANCNEKDLVLFHYGELEAAKREKVKDHLAGYGGCRAKLAELRRLLDDLPSPDLALPEVETHRLSAVISERVLQRSKPKRWVLGSTLAAAATLAIGLMIFPGGPTSLTGGLPRSEAEIGMLQDMELLQNSDLLENLDLLQELERVG
jgi:anti-sigma factor RsiW